MKKLLPTLILGLLSSITPELFAQISITASDLPSAGKDFIVGNDTTPSISIGVAGSTPQVWDFTGLGMDYYKAVAYESSAASPYGAQFPASNINTYGPSWWFGSLYGGAPVDQNQYGYMYWASDANGLRIVGWRATNGEFADINVFEQPQELLIGVPGNYGAQFSNTSRWELPMAKNPADVDTFYVTRRVKTMTVDATGDATTPYGTFPVVRYHEYVTQTDSAYAKMNGSVVYSMLLSADTVNNYMFMAKNIGYPIAIAHADKNNQLKDMEYLMDTTCTVWTTVKVQVTDPFGGVVQGATVSLLIPQPDSTQMVVAQSDITDMSGNVEFDHVQSGMYTLSVSGTNSLLTYLGNTSSWTAAESFYSTCEDTMYHYITVDLLSAMTGTGSCSGYITQSGSGKNRIGAGTTLGDPVPGVDVSLEQIPGGIMAHTLTDATGFYEFQNLYVDSTYKIHVEIPGVPQDSTYTFTVTAGSSDHTDLNFVVDTTEGSSYITVDSTPFGTIENSAVLFSALTPNPASAYFVFRKIENSRNALDLIVIDITGNVVVQSKVNAGALNRISVENLAQGVYSVVISEQGVPVNTQKLVVIR